MVRKCSRGIAEIALMEVSHVGVMTRARAASLRVATSTSGKVKRKKVNDGGLAKLSSSHIQLRSRRRVVSSKAKSEIARMKAEGQYSSPSLDRLQTSRCSSNGSSELAEEKIEFVDLKESAEFESSTHNSYRQRREMTPLSVLREESDGVESTAKPTVENSRRRSIPASKMPTELELEEFFVAAEKDTQKRFADMYNYDIVKDMPLEGRYEWVRLKQ